jgi:hypothetical protein
MTTQSYAWIALAWLWAGCRDAVEAPSVEAKYGLQPSEAYRPVVRMALAATNLILAAASSGPRPRQEAHNPDIPIQPQLRFVAGWSPTEPAGDNDVRLYLVRGGGLGAHEVAFVPPQQSCVFLNTDGLTKLFQTLGIGLDRRNSEIIKLDERLSYSILVFLFLHEAAHIHFQDAGHDPGKVNLSLDEILSKTGVALNRELRADFFAAETLNHAHSILPNPGASLSDGAPLADSSQQQAKGSLPQLPEVLSETLEAIWDLELTARRDVHTSDASLSCSRYSHSAYEKRLLVLYLYFNQNPDPAYAEELRWAFSCHQDDPRLRILRSQIILENLPTRHSAPARTWQRLSDLLKRKADSAKAEISRPR